MDVCEGLYTSRYTQVCKVRYAENSSDLAKCVVRASFTRVVYRAT